MSTAPRACLGLLLLMLATGAWAGARIEVEAKSFDAGAVERGEIIEHVFLFRNTGDEPLRITNVRPSCGCTVAGSYDREILPRSEGLLPIELDTEEFRGRISKTITVTSNAENEPRVVLQIKALVTLPLEILPNPSVYLRTEAGRAAEGLLLLRPHRAGLTVTGASSSDPRVTVRIEPAAPEDRPEGAGPLVARLRPADGDQWLRVRVGEELDAGEIVAQVDVSTSDPTLPGVPIRVRARVEEPASARGGS